MKVFLGSPFKGLEAIREDLHADLSSTYEVSWMEDFGSQELATLLACFREIDDVNVYVLLFGANYGTCPPGSDHSYTHLEYEHASDTGTPVLAYVQKLPRGVRRDPDAEDFLAQVKSSHLLEYTRFDSPDTLIKFVRRDIERLRPRLLRPKFSSTSPVRDEESYVIGAVKTRVLQGTPFTITLVDAAAVSDPQYRPEKHGRIGKKIASIERVAASQGALPQVFNDLPVKRKGDVVEIKAKRVNRNARLIVIIVPKKPSEQAIVLFESAKGDRAVFHGDWFQVVDGDYYVETYSDSDLTTCGLRASIVDFIETRVDIHVVSQLV